MRRELREVWIYLGVGECTCCRVGMSLGITTVHIFCTLMKEVALQNSYSILTLSSLNCFLLSKVTNLSERRVPQ